MNCRTILIRNIVGLEGAEFPSGLLGTIFVLLDNVVSLLAFIRVDFVSMRDEDKCPFKEDDVKLLFELSFHNNGELGSLSLDLVMCIVGVVSSVDKDGWTFADADLIMNEVVE